MISKILVILSLVAGIVGVALDFTNAMLLGVIIGLSAVTHAIFEKK